MCLSGPTQDHAFLYITQEHPKKLFARMKINDKVKLVKFQIDCGTPCNVVSSDIIPGNVKIQKGQRTLIVYNGQKIGTCKMILTNPKNGESYDENYVDVNSWSHPILGSSTS